MAIAAYCTMITALQSLSVVRHKNVGPLAPTVAHPYSEGGLGGDGRPHLNINPIHTEFGELLGNFVSLYTND